MLLAEPVKVGVEVVGRRPAEAQLGRQLTDQSWGLLVVGGVGRRQTSGERIQTEAAEQTR